MSRRVTPPSTPSLVVASVNLFDLGIVLAVAFLLAALASIGVDPEQIDRRRSDKRAERPAANTVVADERKRVDEVELAPGERVGGRGTRVGTVYRLGDGRTVIVREAERR